MDFWENPRMPSQVVQTYGDGSEYDGWLKDWNGRYSAMQTQEAAAKQAAIAAEAANKKAAFDALLSSAGDANFWAGAGQGPLVQQSPGDMANYASNLGITRKVSDGPNAGVQETTPLDLRGRAEAMWNGGALDSPYGMFSQAALDQFDKARSRTFSAPKFDYSALDGEYTDKSKGALEYADAFTRNTSAYNQQLGGGFVGGLVDASYNDPFSSQISGNAGGLGGLGGMPQDPSMPGVAMPWAQPWGTPGFGQPGQGNSEGVGSYGPAGQQSGQQQQGNNGWGGPFGSRNPWSLG